MTTPKQCADVRRALGAIRTLDELGESSTAPEAVHLHECASCREYWSAQERENQILTAAMHDMPVPADLATRLLTRLTAAISETEPAAVETTSVPVRQPAASGWSRRAWIAAACACLMLAGGWWLWPRTEPARVTIAQLVDEIHDTDWNESQLPLFQGSNLTQLPAALRAADIWFPASLAQQAPHALQLAGQQVAALYSFRQKTLDVVLIVSDLRQIQLLDSDVGHSFPMSEPRYFLKHKVVAKAWQRDQWLYVCLLRTDHSDAFKMLELAPRFN